MQCFQEDLEAKVKVRKPLLQNVYKNLIDL